MTRCITMTIPFIYKRNDTFSQFNRVWLSHE